jgi:hypothetical protein
VIAIIAILIGLLLPAVQKVRAAAARAKCSNNMKQLGLAIHNYENTYAFLPPVGTTINNAKGHSVFTYLLPYVEQQNVYAHINVNAPLYDKSNMAPPLGTNTFNPFGTNIPTFICPSAPPRVTDYGQAHFLPVAPGIAIFGSTDYASLDGIGAAYASLAGGVPSGHTGVLQFATLVNGDYSVKAKFSDVIDGLSNTVILAEDAGRTPVYRMGQLVPNVYSEGAWGDYDVEYFTHGSNLDGSGGRCAINCTNENEVYSFHNGGALYQMGDGHVAFVRADIDPTTQAALISRAGGEIVTPP